ncbi:DNA ligase D [Evansella sp. AB-P1]|uniref:DNA ligase D n=1 Tax=Evansella sp. AB-P1 TaxID=3037653 RepID=UPI00241F59B7|nr:DNA ligase D [Evansella sp. AB-P1]MDG5786950.1 DNA ligase D [Evansella sp. AB-P1]
MSHKKLTTKKNTLFPKIKKDYTGLFIVTGYHQKLDEFTVGVLKNNELTEVGTFSNGLSKEEKHTLKTFILNKNKGVRQQHVKIELGICVELTFSHVENENLESPEFITFRTDVSWETCTWGKLLLMNGHIDKSIQITSPDKPIWNNPYVNKDQYISYLYEISPYILPFLNDRIVTVLRFPHGVHDEAFYQKNCPDYAPPFITTFEEDNINYIVCNDPSTLIWLGNQLALEFHVPFNTIKSSNPNEIVFDLDPPSKDYFPLAIKGAMEMHRLFEKFQITSYPKLSGNKGIQIHIPIMDSQLTYKETRYFTEFIANYLVEKFPNDFTVERMKKKRKNKLYIDFVQHWSGKTIICPYSLRGVEGATVAAPLYWEEVNKNLHPNNYQLYTMLDRLNTISCPLKDYFQQKNESVKEIITSIKEKQKK